MKCNIPDNDLFLYADGSLPAERRISVESHINECRECGEFLSFLGKTLEVVNKDKEIRENPFLFTRIMAKLEEEKRPYWLHSIKNIPSFAFSIVLIGVILGGINLGRLYSGNLSGYGNELQEEITYLDDIKQEQIEIFFFTSNDEENE